MTEKCNEWAIPLCIFDGDIRQAYGNVLHKHVLHGVLHAGVSRLVAAAYLRELRRMRSRFVLDKNTKTMAIRKTKALLQRDPMAPRVFNQVVDLPAQEFLVLCDQEGWGVRLDGGEKLALILYADNFWVLSQDPSSFPEMTQAWLQILRKYGFDIAIEEASWTCNLAGNLKLPPVILDGKTVERRSRHEGFKVLGTMHTANGKQNEELKMREQRFWKAFWKYETILCCHSAPLLHRVRFLNLIFCPVYLWCAGSWHLTRAQLTNIAGMRQQMRRNIVKLQRHDGESDKHYFSRKAGILKRLDARHGLPSWFTTGLQLGSARV